jgi:hypothetical protein
MTTSDQPPRHWPDDEPVVVPEVKLTRRARLGRFLGDVFLIDGMAKGLSGNDHARSDGNAITNAMLINEGREQGRKANE